MYLVVYFKHLVVFYLKYTHVQTADPPDDSGASIVEQLPLEKWRERQLDRLQKQCTRKGDIEAKLVELDLHQQNPSIHIEQNQKETIC